MTDREKVIIDRFDAEKELVWTDDDQFTMGYNNGLEVGKNLALELLKQQECKSCGIVFDYGYKVVPITHRGKVFNTNIYPSSAFVKIIYSFSRPILAILAPDKILY